jgi:phage regulator Rha-like protein
MAKMKELLVARLDFLEEKLTKLQDVRGVDTRMDQAIVKAGIEELTWAIGLFPN